MIRHSLVLILGLGAIAACGGGHTELPDAPPGQPDAANPADAAPDAMPVDTDGDGIADATDNCPLVVNPGQDDADGDGTGDACDADTDGDGVDNPDDNCPDVANPTQTDTDDDGVGDDCDPDADGDGVLNAADNCPLIVNPTQDDNDIDGAGDVCDDDDDNDSVLDAADNCPLTANPTQDDADTDGAGDACDDDDDNDGVPDGSDTCPLVANPLQSDLDGDGLGDDCDPDDDNDGILDPADNCPRVANPTQDDTDADGIGDACASDVITPFVSGTIVGGNIASAGAGFAGRGTGIAVPQVDITIAGIPATASVLNTYLYWTVIGTPYDTVTLNGTTVTGTLIGTTGDTCWGIGNNFMYRADVTALTATGNGTYTVGNLLSSAVGGPDGQGASLVAIYQDSADPRANYVGISDGGIGFVGVGTSASTAASGFTVGVGFDRVTAINLVADGQPFPDELYIQGTQYGGGDAFPGAQGTFWDNRVDDATMFVSAGATSVSTQISSSSDCLAWSMSAIVIEDVDAASFVGSLVHHAIPTSTPIPSTPVRRSTSAIPVLRTGGRMVPR